MQQKRNYPRHDTILYLHVYSLPERTPIARVADISAGGVLLLSRTSFPHRHPFAAAIALPPGAAESREEFTCTITPQWERKDENPALLLTGCSMEIPADARPLLNDLISRFGFSSENTDFRRLFEEQ